MKKLICSVLALVSLFTMTVMPVGASETDVTDTSVNYLISSKEYETITVPNAKVYGFIGNVDDDKEVSVMDATEIQHYIAKKVTLNATAKLLADTDRDTDVSVLDVTAIQRFIARLSTKAKVAHTLYEIIVTDEKIEVYNQLIDYLKKNGKYSEQNDIYQIDIQERNDDGTPGDNFMFRWDSKDDYINISHYTDDAYMYLTIRPDETSYSARIYEAGSSKTFCNTLGTLTLDGTNPKDLELKYYTHRGSATFEEACPVIIDKITLAMDYLESLVGNEIDGNLYSLF